MEGLTPWQQEFAQKYHEAGYWFNKTISSPVKVSVADAPAPVFCHSIPFGVLILSFFYRPDADKSPLCLSGDTVALPGGIHGIRTGICQESDNMQANSACYRVGLAGAYMVKSCKSAGPLKGRICHYLTYIWHQNATGNECDITNS